MISESWVGAAEVIDGKIVYCNTPLAMAIEYPYRTEKVLREMCARNRWTIDDVTETPTEELFTELFGALRYLLAVHTNEGGDPGLALFMAWEALAKAEQLRDGKYKAADAYIAREREKMATASA